MKKLLSAALISIILLSGFTGCSKSKNLADESDKTSQETSIYDYSSFIGIWHKADPDGLNGDVPLEISDLKNNKEITFSIDGGESATKTIENNQVKWTEQWEDGSMDLTLTFYDDYVYLEYSRCAIEWYSEIKFVSDDIKPRKITT